MLQLATLLKVTLLHGCFSPFLNCTNGTESRKASEMKFSVLQFFEVAWVVSKCSVSWKDKDIHTKFDKT